MDPRKFLRMAALGMDEEILKSDWAWQCTMCWRCMYVCPMKIDIPQLIFHTARAAARKSPQGHPRLLRYGLEERLLQRHGAKEEDFQFVVEDRGRGSTQHPGGLEDLQAPINKQGAMYFVNQNSREPVTEPDEMVPLWKILHKVGADWTYGTKGWAAENYCMFLADDEGWKHIVEVKAKAVDDLGCKYWVNTE